MVRGGVIRDEGAVAGGGDELSGFEVTGIAGEVEGAVVGDVRDGDRALNAQFVALFVGVEVVNHVGSGRETVIIGHLDARKVGKGRGGKERQ